MPGSTPSSTRWCNTVRGWSRCSPTITTSVARSPRLRSCSFSTRSRPRCWPSSAAVRHPQRRSRPGSGLRGRLARAGQARRPGGVQLGSARTAREPGRRGLGLQGRRALRGRDPARTASRRARPATGHRPPRPDDPDRRRGLAGADGGRWASASGRPPAQAAAGTALSLDELRWCAMRACAPVDRDPAPPAPPQSTRPQPRCAATA